MLALERRPVEASARAMFLQVRAQAHDVLIAGFGGLLEELTQSQVDQLVTYAIAGADGLFIAKEIGGDAVDLVAMFALHASAILDLAGRMAAMRLAGDGPRLSTRRGAGSHTAVRATTKPPTGSRNHH